MGTRVASRRGISVPARGRLDRHATTTRCDASRSSWKNFFVGFFDFDSWAPRSSRAWRLQERIAETETKVSIGDELGRELQERILQETAAQWEASEQGQLTGVELRNMMFAKYGRLYDLNFRATTLPVKKLLVLNVMWTWYGQKSFPLSEEQYMMKLEGIASTVRMLNGEKVVRDFFARPPKPEGGLPARPVVGTAVSIRFRDTPDAVISELFS